MATIAELEKYSGQIRRDALRMIHAVQSGHPGGSLGCADFLAALYVEIMQHQPKPFSMDGRGEDLFFLSNGHLSAVWYAILARTGYFDKSELATFRKIHSRLQGHPTTAENLPGIRMASGSLGQGLSVGIGAALAKKQLHDKGIVFTLHGDGELQEGQIWEAALYAGAKQVDNIIATVDYNGQQIDGPVERVCSLGNLRAKWEAFNWKVIEVNGNCMSELVPALQEAKQQCGKSKPILMLMKTEMGYGVDFMMGGHHWHGSAPNDTQLSQALAQLPESLGDF